MEPFKNRYNSKSIEVFASELKKSYPPFDVNSFKKQILKDLPQLEMKDRVCLISDCIASELKLSYPAATKILLNSIGENKINGFMIWPISHFVATHGLDHLTLSMNAMKKITTFFTAEFCIRPFLKKYDQEVFNTLIKWRSSKNPHIRRLISEGSRPNLPWGMKVDSINTNLKRGAQLITPLRLDSSEYVRKSVANHLNDISRLDEKLFFKTIESFKETTPEVAKIVRHASRTLLKAGNPRALKLHGYKTPIKLEAVTKLSKKKIIEGGSLPIDLFVTNSCNRKQKVLIDYVIHFLKKNGEYSKKVFRFKDTIIEPNSEILIKKRIPFKKVTTRVHYSGKHFLSIQINGKVFCKESFILKI